MMLGMRMNPFSPSAVLVLAGLMVGCSSGKGAPTAAMQIGSKTFQLEIAADDASREHGLMERDELPADHGMIFIFDSPAPQDFWMHHTRFPLDIIFADQNSRIVSIKTMQALDENTTKSDGVAKYAIEINAGQAAACGVKAGQQLQFPPQVTAGMKK